MAVQPSQNIRAGKLLTSCQFHITDVIDRMPVILHPKDYDRWLERDSERPPIDLLRPFESEQMVKWACNPLVGNVRNNGPEMLSRHQE